MATIARRFSYFFSAAAEVMVRFEQEDGKTRRKDNDPNLGWRGRRLGQILLADAPIVAHRSSSE